MSWLFGKMLAFSSKEYNFVLVTWLFYFHNFVQILFERSLFD